MSTRTDTVHIASPVEASALATREGLLDELRRALPPGKRVVAVRVVRDDDTLVGEVEREWVERGVRREAGA